MNELLSYLCVYHFHSTDNVELIETATLLGSYGPDMLVISVGYRTTEVQHDKLADHH